MLSFNPVAPFYSEGFKYNPRQRLETVPKNRIRDISIQREERQRVHNKMASKTSKNSEFQKKRRSRDAARSRRGQQNDEFVELANQLPLPVGLSSQLDRLCIMRLVNSYIKMKNLLRSYVSQDIKKLAALNLANSSAYEKSSLEALDGFVFVVTPDGQCTYVSDNINHYMGLTQIEVTGNSLYKYIHPCDHEELANQLGGQIPLEDMEIFDGLFCSDSVFMMSNHLKGGSKKAIQENPHKSFFLRMKSTLTSRGKSVNLRASTYRVVHCTGSMKTLVKKTNEGEEEKVPLFMVAIAVPLMFSSTFEVPLDRATFTSRHSLDMNFLSCDDSATGLLGFSPAEIVGKSWYHFLHACDLDTALACHKTLLTKGQSVSKYYRFLLRTGGWVWLQTKANIVYDSKTCQPQFVLCTNYMIVRADQQDFILSTEQVNPVPAPMALDLVMKKEKPEPRGTRRKHSIVLEERTKLLKAAAHEQRQTKEVAPKQESTLDNTCCMTAKEPSKIAKKTCKCLGDVDCEHMNFQDCLPVAWDTNEDLIEQQEKYEQILSDHYTISRQPGVVENSPGDYRTPFIPSPSEDLKINADQEKTDEDEENYDERAPFIPLSIDDTELEDDLLVEIPFIDSPMTPSPSSWLLNADESIPSPGAAAIISMPAPTKAAPHKKVTSLSASSSPIVSRKEVPSAVKRNGYITNDMASRGKGFFPSISSWDAEVNLPVQQFDLLQGEDLLKALDCGDLCSALYVV